MIRPARPADVDALARRMKVGGDEGRWLATEPSATGFEVEGFRRDHYLREDGLLR